MIGKIMAMACMGLAFAGGSASLKAAPALDGDTVVVFRAGDNGYDNYRIPSVITTRDGSLVAFAEARRSMSDAGDIDLVCKRSADGGKTWSAQQVVWDDGANTCGNPCPVVDRKTGAILLLMTHNLGTDREKAIIRGTSRESRTVWICESTDNGASWSAPREITAEVKDPSWGWYATGPGIGIQMLHGPYRGRLVIPADFSYRDTSAAGAVSYQYGSCSFYSDDDGKTWHPGGIITPKVNECQVAELPGRNGTLMMNMRSYFGRHCRAVATSLDGGAHWSPPVDAPELIEPVCQASFLLYRGRSHRKDCLLFLNPASATSRSNMTLRASFDRGRSWPQSKVLYAGPSAYSSLTELPSGEIGALYEGGVKSPYEYIVFQTIRPYELFQGSARKAKKNK
jgi:sialidase-1